MNVKKVLLLCLFLTAIIAVPVQGQAPTAVPPAPTQWINPDELAPCGLPAGANLFNSGSTITTFTLRADCEYYTWSTIFPDGILEFAAGTYTLNGNGHSIVGPPNSWGLWIEGANTVFNMNNIIFRNNGGSQSVTIQVDSGARLNARNVIIRNNAARSALLVGGTNSRADLQNVQFLNNGQASAGGAVYGSAITVNPGGTVNITNGIFTGNRNTAGRNEVIAAIGSGASVTLDGCITFSNNVRSDGTTAATPHQAHTSGGGTGTIDASGITGTCPAEGFSFDHAKSKPKKTATPRPSATARPLATTCIDLSLATGIVVHATYGLDSGVQCQRLGGGGIGVASIVEAGFIDAVDVWGYVEQGVEVCFPQAGELLFLDASMMPRVAAPLAATVVNGMTCGAIESPGSIVLMPPP